MWRWFISHRIVAWVLVAFFHVAVVHAANSSLEDRIDQENQWSDLRIPILPHRPTYFLPVAYNTNPNDGQFPNEPTLKNTEIKYQISFKVPLIDGLYRDKGRLFVAYTQICFWQAYNKTISSPFRDTNYEPEGFVQFDTDQPVGGLRNRLLRLGFVHQSNGRSEPLSRSWNRIYSEFILDRKNLLVSLKPWYRIPESSEEDNNPDIWKYLGYGELRLALKCAGHREFSLLFRNNLKVEGNKGAIELTWMRPLLKNTDLMLQYFNGYGESLLDYNHPVNRFSVGFAFSNWLG